MFVCSRRSSFSQISYALGSFIPCALIVSSSNPQVLEVMASPSAPRVLLKRRLFLRSKLGGELILDDQHTTINKASWMPFRESPRSRSSSRKILEGEISIPQTAAPSFTFGKLELKVRTFYHPVSYLLNGYGFI